MALATHSDATKARALRAYARTGTVKAACEAAQIARRTWYDWMQDDEAFAKAAVDAREAVADELVEEAVQRAKDGSDTLIIFLLKSMRRSEYGDKQTITVTSPDVQGRLVQQAQLIASQPTWDSQTLLDRLGAEVWK